jgi:hypothetical protein
MKMKIIKQTLPISQEGCLTRVRENTGKIGACDYVLRYFFFFT